jgi:hypothetical protein
VTAAPRYLFVLTRDGPGPEVSAAAVGVLTGVLAGWVAALRRWQLLAGVAVDQVPAQLPAARSVRGCLLVAAGDLPAARRVAASCPVGCGTVLVLPLGEVPAGER